MGFFLHKYKQSIHYMMGKTNISAFGMPKVLKMEQMSCCISIEKLTCVTCEFGRLYLVITFFVNLQDMWRRQLVRNCTIIQTQTLKKHILTSKCDNLKIFLCVTFVKHDLSYLCR